MRRRISSLLWLLAGVWSGSGCAYYSTSGGLIGGIRSVGIPVAENATVEFGLGELLSERLTEAYTRDGQLRVVDEESADAVLYLQVVELDDAPFTYTAAELTQQYRFRVRISVQLVRVGDGEKLFEQERLEGWGTYDAALPDEEGRDLAAEAALNMVIEEIVDRTTAGW